MQQHLDGDLLSMITITSLSAVTLPLKVFQNQLILFTNASLAAQITNQSPDFAKRRQKGQAISRKQQMHELLPQTNPKALVRRQLRLTCPAFNIPMQPTVL